MQFFAGSVSWARGSVALGSKAVELRGGRRGRTMQERPTVKRSRVALVLPGGHCRYATRAAVFHVQRAPGIT
jgi:hypothetical protein